MATNIDSLLNAACSCVVSPRVPHEVTQAVRGLAEAVRELQQQQGEK